MHKIGRNCLYHKKIKSRPSIITIGLFLDMFFLKLFPELLLISCNMWGGYLKNIVNWKCQITKWDIHAKIIWAFSLNENLICNYKIKSEYCVLEFSTNLILASTDKFFYIVANSKKFAPISNNGLLFSHTFLGPYFADCTNIGIRIPTLHTNPCL